MTKLVLAVTTKTVFGEEAREHVEQEDAFGNCSFLPRKHENMVPVVWHSV